MNPVEHNWVTKSTERTLAVFAVICMIAFALFLTGCTVCPDQECPVFPNAAPRQ